MQNDIKALPKESKETRIKKEIDYLKSRFPWKSRDEIATVFTAQGEVDQKALKQLSVVHYAAASVDD